MTPDKSPGLGAGSENCSMKLAFPPSKSNECTCTVPAACPPA